MKNATIGTEEEQMEMLTPEEEQALSEHIDTEMEKSKFMFQLISHENGYRSQPFMGNWTTLREVLREAKEKEEPPAPEDYILLVAILNGEDTTIPATPLITVKTFMEYENAHEENKETKQRSGTETQAEKTRPEIAPTP